MASDSLLVLTQAERLLAQANSIQELKELKDLALTAHDWAQRKNMGEAAIAHCRYYAFEAERRLGEMLAVKEPAYRPGPGRGKGGNGSVPPLSDTPSLAELGTSKRESFRAQQIAALSRKIFEAVRDGKKLSVLGNVDTGSTMARLQFSGDFL